MPFTSSAEGVVAFVWPFYGNRKRGGSKSQCFGLSLGKRLICRPAHMIGWSGIPLLPLHLDHVSGGKGACLS